MNLHLRKMAQSQIDLSKSKRDFSTPDKYEEWILECFDNDNANESLGALTVLCADLLEQVRRADPAYGLVAVDHIPFGALDPADREQSREDERNAR